MSQVLENVTHTPPTFGLQAEPLGGAATQFSPASIINADNSEDKFISTLEKPR
jgi:hypothetical protein